jgi:hypothetical protein
MGSLIKVIKSKVINFFDEKRFVMGLWKIGFAIPLNESKCKGIVFNNR